MNYQRKKKEIVLAIDTDENVSTKTIMNKLDMNVKTFSVYRDRLIKKGIIASLNYGIIVFTLPRFREFLLLK